MYEGIADSLAQPNSGWEVRMAMYCSAAFFLLDVEKYETKKPTLVVLPEGGPSLAVLVHATSYACMFGRAVVVLVEDQALALELTEKMDLPPQVRVVTAKIEQFAKTDQESYGVCIFLDYTHKQVDGTDMSTLRAIVRLCSRSAFLFLVTRLFTRAARVDAEALQKVVVEATREMGSEKLVLSYISYEVAKGYINKFASMQRTANILTASVAGTGTEAVLCLGIRLDRSSGNIGKKPYEKFYKQVKILLVPSAEKAAEMLKKAPKEFSFMAEGLREEWVTRHLPKEKDST